MNKITKEQALKNLEHLKEYASWEPTVQGDSEVLECYNNINKYITQPSNAQVEEVLTDLSDVSEYLTLNVTGGIPIKIHNKVTNAIEFINNLPLTHTQSNAQVEEALEGLGCFPVYDDNMDYVGDISDEKEWKQIKQALTNTPTTPTEKDVCKAILELTTRLKNILQDEDKSIKELETERNYFKNIALNKVDMNIILTENGIVELPTYEQLENKYLRMVEAVNTCTEISAQRVDTINAIREIVEDWSTTKCMPEDVGNFAFSTLVKIKEVLDK